MNDHTQVEVAGSAPARAKGALLITAGGLAAAFCAASCCGLPVLLGSIGLGSGWLVGVAWLAAPHRTILLVAAVVFLAGGSAAFLWRRRLSACAAGASPARRAATAALTAMLVIGGVLVVLGYLYT